MRSSIDRQFATWIAAQRAHRSIRHDEMVAARAIRIVDEVVGEHACRSDVRRTPTPRRQLDKSANRRLRVQQKKVFYRS
jgi:hypothetical protein